MREMRRQDRKLTEEEAMQILTAAEYGVLSTVCEDGTPYAVPISFAVEEGCIYMHCTVDGGQKIDNLRRNPAACFTAVSETKLLPDKFGTLYLSAIARGKVEIITDPEEKMKGLMALLRKYSADFMESGIKYANASVNKVYILRLPIETITGKGRKK
ncbi:MAG: pyridoxamine 5'-phosphate oxidase family protein [Stomatobaculum sp.]|nr:pyridoxamine 5'-phosphate oxidase family protein [Stomatobaculum sp.]